MAEHSNLAEITQSTHHAQSVVSVEGLDAFIELAANTIGHIGIAFIIVGAAIATIQYFYSWFNNRYTSDHVRLTLGTYILTGLEFMVGQDIIETVLHTTRTHLIDLAIIVVIRTVLDFFLSREMTHLKEHIKEHEHQYAKQKK